MRAKFQTPITLAAMALAFTLVYGCCGGGTSSTDLDNFDVSTPDTGSDTGAAAGALKSCNDMKSLSTCSEHQPKAFTILGEDFFKGVCELVDGTWGTDACPTADRVGTCDDGEGSVTYYYSAGGDPYDAAKAETDCKESLGTFK